MSKKPLSRPRQRLIDDITARRLSEDTKRNYVRNVRKFAAFLGRSLDTRRARIFVAVNCTWRSSSPAPNDQRRHRRAAVLFHRDARKARSCSSFEDRDQATQGAGRPEPGGVARLLQAAPSLKYKTALSVASYDPFLHAGRHHRLKKPRSRSISRRFAAAAAFGGCP